MKKVIVITGGSDGAGKEIAKKLASNNKVIILSNTEEKLKKVANEINCNYEVCDVSNYEEVNLVIKNIIKKYNKIDCLINNAGLWIEGELENNEYETIKKVIEVNTLGVIYTTKAVIPYMKIFSDGLIININSQAGINYKEGRTIYNASKWAVTGFTKSLQPELAGFGIRVTDVFPGMMKTEMFSKVGIQKNMESALELKELVRVIEFILETDKNINIPEIGIKNIKNQVYKH